MGHNLGLGRIPATIPGALSYMRKNKDLEDSVKNQVTKLNIRAFSIGCSVALLAFACGSENNGGDNNDVVEPPTDNGGGVQVDRPAPQTCEENPLLAICAEPDPVTVPDPGSGNVPDPGNNPPANNDSPKDIAQAAAENILRANCGQCHGPALTPEQARAGSSPRRFRPARRVTFRCSSRSTPTAR